MDRIKPLWYVLIILLSILLISGCGIPKASPKLSLETLKNAQYLRFDNTYVRLANGTYEITVSGSRMTPTLWLWEKPMAFADLNSDGYEDAVVILEYDSGGSAQAPILAVVLNKGGVPFNVAVESLGDRTQINGVHIEGDIITLDVVTHRPEDALCCPTLDATWKFQFKNNQLIPLQ